MVSFIEADEYGFSNGFRRVAFHFTRKTNPDTFGCNKRIYARIVVWLFEIVPFHPKMVRS